MGRIGQFIKELRHRRIFRAATIYVVVAWGATEILSFVLETLPFPSWTVPVVAIGFIVGFPVAMILAWHFDVTREGIRSTPPVSTKGELTILFSLVLLVGGTTGLFYLIFPAGVVEPEITVVVQPFEPPEGSIAVLPFVDLSRDRDQEYLADGLTETILHQLAQNSELHVIARTSSFVFKGDNRDIREIGRKLNVGSILEGSVQKANGKLRITAQLIDCLTGAHIWSRNFDRADQDVFEIQDEISLAVANQLVSALRPVKTSGTAQQFTEDIEAYDLYLKGRHEWYKRSETSIRKAIDYFKQAIEIDPEFALAYTGLADALGVLPDYSNVSVDEITEEAEHALRTALDLNPALAEAFATRGLIRMQAGRYDQADNSYRRAIDLNPGYAMAHMWYGRSLIFQKRYGDALPVFRTASLLDPLSAVVSHNLGTAYYWTGQFNEARKVYTRTVEVDRESYFGFFGLAMTAKAAGRLDEAVSWYLDVMDRRPDDPLLVRELAWTYSGLGEDRLADRWIGRVERVDAANPYVIYGRKLLFLERGTPAEFESYTNRNVDEMPDNKFMLADAALASAYSGKFGRAREMYERLDIEADGFPAPLFESWDFMYCYSHALNLINVYQKTGSGDKAKALAHRYSDFLALHAERGMWLPCYAYLEATLHSLSGNISLAMSSLSTAYAGGWRNYRMAKHDPNLESMRSHSRFEEIIRRTETDVDTMRRRLTEETTRPKAAE